YYPYAGNSTSRSFNAKSGTAWNTDKAGTGFELVKDNKSIDKFQFVDTSSSAAKGKFYYIDNVRIYYKPTQLDWQPGLNLLTGNEAPFDFEGVTNEQLDALGWERRTAGDIAGSIWNIAEEQENTFLSTKRQYRYISPCQWKPIEADRPIALSLKVKTNSNDGFYILVNAGENTSIDYKFYDDGVAKYTVRGVWDSRTFTLQKNDGNTYGSVSSGVFNDIMNNGINSIAVGFGYCSEGTYIDGKAYGYIDDYSIIPYYKVTYHVGTGEFVDYVLPADGLFTPDPTYCYGASTYKVGEEGAWQDISTPYTLEHEDIDVYINFSDNVQTLTEHSIRTAGTQALRFSGSVSNEIIKGNESSSTFEFGFIVSRGDYVEYFAAANGITDEKLLTFDGADVSTESANGVYKNSYGLPFVYGSSYRMLNGTLKKNQTTPTDQASFFTAALTGIPDTNYKTPICGRTYVRIGDLYFYGEVEETSVYDVAKAMLNDGGLDSETAALIQGIIDKVDGTSTASET
ncbi:MAG: hypothetical protein ACI3XQ_00910, partial [Eubacteriales bacterium]